jgi:D-alanine-D-alanine ligase
MKKRVLILYGGRSVEHGVSINSARNIHEFIDKDKFEPILIGISQTGGWYLTTQVSKDIEAGKPLSFDLNPSSPHFKTPDGLSFSVDIVFPVLHGTDGEDGSIQGFLKAFSLPMIGTGVLGSSLSMSKLVAKQKLAQAGLPVSEFLYCYYSNRAEYSFVEVKEKLGLPFMVKSANLGSSVGVSKVKSEVDFLPAVNEAFKYDECVLFEKFIDGREIECAILGNDPPKASLPGEVIVSSKYDFYTFDAKYVDGNAVSIDVPAKITQSESDLIREISIKSYQALACEDFARVDLFLTKKGEVFVNEINTIPGFTNSSMFPVMWKERGISFVDLITTLIELATQRHTKLQRIQTKFDSSLKF